MNFPHRGRGARHSLLCLAVSGRAGLLGCRRDDALGPPDSFLVYTPVRDAGGTLVRSRAGLVVVEPIGPDDPRAAPLWKEFAVGFAAEVLRTDYLAKQFVRDAEVGGARYPDDLRAAAGEPTVFVIGAPPWPAPMASPSSGASAAPKNTRMSSGSASRTTRLTTARCPRL